MWTLLIMVVTSNYLGNWACEFLTEAILRIPPTKNIYFVPVWNNIERLVGQAGEWILFCVLISIRQFTAQQGGKRYWYQVILKWRPLWLRSAVAEQSVEQAPVTEHWSTANPLHAWCRNLAYLVKMSRRESAMSCHLWPSVQKTSMLLKFNAYTESRIPHHSTPIFILVYIYIHGIYQVYNIYVPHRTARLVDLFVALGEFPSN